MMVDEDVYETLKGELKRIRFSSEDGTFSICELIVPNRILSVTLVGNIMSAQPGESVEVTGQWKDDARFGRQFKIKTIHSVPPITKEGIERYLSGGFIDGIGKTLASRIVDAFGVETLDILDEDPARLSEVDGIGKVRCARIVEAWQGQRAIRNIMVFLHSHGVSSTYAVKIFKLYGDNSVHIILENPYRLAEDIFGIGFRKADAIALTTGLDPGALPRLRAGLQYALTRAHQDGHMFLPLDDLKLKALELLEVESDALGDAIEDLRMRQKIVVEPLGPDQPVIVYRAKAYRAEVDAARHLRRLLDATMLLQNAVPSHKVDEVQTIMGITLASAQREAVTAAWTNKVNVLTGGPGTGKTTIVRAIVSLGHHLNQRLLLAAPTGRAAKRMSEATGEEARTLHRLLEFSFQQGGFQRDEDNPLDVDMLIVDEASMIDTYLLVALLKALPDQARVLFVGDVDQLPSVGPGSVLSDLIHSNVIHVVRLDEIFRQAQDSSIILNAHRVNQGLVPVAPERAPGQLSDFYTIESGDPARAQHQILELMRYRIPNAFGYDPIEDVQILSPMHKGQLGCSALNMLLQDKLNPRDIGYERGGRRWKIGDKVMQIRNDYEKEVFNGDVGVISSIETAPDIAIIVQFDSRLVTYTTVDMDELVLAYAMTVHKSQGSEYPVVILPMSTQHYMMLQRNVLYTALTRARHLVIIVGTAKAVGIAVRQEDARRRYTRLIHRLNHATTPGPTIRW